MEHIHKVESLFMFQLLALQFDFYFVLQINKTQNIEERIFQLIFLFQDLQDYNYRLVFIQFNTRSLDGPIIFSQICGFDTILKEESKNVVLMLDSLFRLQDNLGIQYECEQAFKQARHEIKYCSKKPKRLREEQYIFMQII
ncbi:unnamed protein product [Paramecium sonneborni]|uniref:Uncharacterized protein n=1 Tax=Paramecium sonneborni TaxID=65129 RepID=A0A8S1QVM6_9CILI|nr:unnamed protein product [Paramecium sonneborni]